MCIPQMSKAVRDKETLLKIPSCEIFADVTGMNVKGDIWNWIYISEAGIYYNLLKENNKKIVLVQRKRKNSRDGDHNK